MSQVYTSYKAKGMWSYVFQTLPLHFDVQHKGSWMMAQLDQKSQYQIWENHILENLLISTARAALPELLLKTRFVIIFGGAHL